MIVKRTKRIMNTLVFWDIVAMSVCSITIREKPQVTVHIISHSHQDAGWLKTADQYSSQRVNLILTSVITYLRENSDKKFTQAEVWFFKQWWDL